MASSDKDASCANDPDFAVICAFLEKFSEQLLVHYPDFKQLENWLSNTDEVPNGLRDLHIKLMRKTRRTVHECAWETALSKFCFSYSSQDGWEIERFGYKKSSLKVKLRILRELLESQFDRNNKFRAKLLTMTADSLRSEPIGRDRLGHAYWLTQDMDCNLRIYQEHLDEEIWQVVATNRDELVKLISRLRGNEVVLPSEIGVIDEDSSSNSCSAPIVKPPPPEEKDDSQESNQSMEGRIPNIKIKLGNNDNGVVINTDVVSVPNGSEEPAKQDFQEKEEEKKVKPLVISQSKITMEKSKKRPLDEPEKQEPEEVKKQRPSLLDSKREKKLSKYEEANQEEDDDDNEEGEDDEDAEGEDEGEEEEDVEDEEDEADGEEEDVEDEDDEEDDADVDEEDDGEEENEAESEKDTEQTEGQKVADKPEDNDHAEVNQTKNPIIGETIEDPPVIVKEAGNGAECENSYYDFLLLSGELEEEPRFSEIIEESTLVVFGEGTGLECLVGNTKSNEGEPKATFFFGQPGCLKLSPVKNPSKPGESEITQDKEKPEEETNVPEPSNGESHLDKVNETTSEVVSEELITNEDNKESNNSSKELKKPSRQTVINRKRRLSDEKPEKQVRHSSESETDINSEILEDQIVEEEEEDIGGKRQKMRSKQLMNTEIRKKAEAQRKVAAIEETTSSSGEEERPRKKLSPKKVEKEVKPILPLKAKLKQAALAEKKEKEEAEMLQNDGNAIAKKGDDINDVKEPCEQMKSVQGSAPILKCAEDTEPINVNAIDKHTEKPHQTNEPDMQIPKGIPSPEPSPQLFVGNETNKSHPKEPNEETDEEIPKKKQSPEQASRQSPKKRYDEKSPEIEQLKTPEKAPEIEKRKTPEVENIKTPEKEIETSLEDRSTSENQRKRRSSEDDSRAKDVATPKAPPPVVKTRSGRRGGPPEPVAELPQIKRTRVKAADKAKVQKEISQDVSESTRSKVKTPARNTVKKSVIKKEVVDEQMMDVAKEEKPPITVKEESKVEPEIKPTNFEPEPTTPIRPQQQAAQKQPASVQRRKNHDDVDTKNIIDLESDTTPVRQSRRIAQLKIREEADRRKMEEIALRNMKAELKKKKKAEKGDDPTVSEPSEHSSEHEDSEADVEIKKKAEKKKKCRPGKGGWSSGSEEPDQEEEEQYESDPGSPLFRSDHEFSPESELEDESQIVPLKRARTARKEGEEVVATANEDESCQKCNKSDHPEWILLCDKCDKGYHCSCLSPVIFYIPEGDWFCPPCQQVELIVALENHLKEFDDLVHRKKQEEEEKVRAEEQERLEQERAAQVKVEKKNKRKQVRKKKAGSSKYRTHRKNLMTDEDDDDSVENGTASDGSNSTKSTSSRSKSSRSDSATDSDDEPIYKLRKRRQINVSYRLNEYDDMIKSALKEEEDEVAGAGNLGRGKDISTIIEADKEEKLRQQQRDENGEVMDAVEKPQEAGAEPPVAEDSGSDFEPIKRTPKAGRHIKKKSRKLTTLDISSEGDNDSDEDFKTSSMDDEEDEDDEEEDTQSSDSSLEEYRRRRRGGKNKKTTRRAARRSARERRKDRKFIVDDSEGSEEEIRPRLKKKRKKDSDYTETESNDDDDELSENIDSDDLCDDSTSEASDGAWRPSKRKKQSSSTIARKSPKLKPKAAPKAKKTKRVDENSRSFKAGISKNRMIRDDSEEDDSDGSVDSSRKTRGKRCTYLEDYEDESSDGGIKPGVKRPDTPPEEREKFIKKQEEIKRMLAEKNAEGAKLAATPRLVPIKSGAQRSPMKLDSLSTVPLSVIRQAKVLDIDYLQRKGESISEGDLDESEFDDDDLPDDFNPEDMDEEAIARMVEEEDFAQQQQIKLPSPAEVLRKKPTKEVESIIRPTAAPFMQQPQLQSTSSSASGLQEPIRKKLPMPTLHPPLLRHGYGPPSQHMLQHGRSSGQQPHLPLLQNALSAPLNHPRSFPPTTQAIPATTQGIGASQAGAPGDPNKPRGRRKKITPLRDPLQKQQAAAAASAAAQAAKPPNSSLGKADAPKQGVGGSVASPGVIKSALSIAQPPQLYKPPQVNTQPSVITRMPHLQGRPPPMMPPVGGPPPFPEQGSRFYGPPPPQQQHPQPPQRQAPPNALLPHGSRPPIRHRGPPMPQMQAHHTLRPSYVGGPPPLRSSSGPPISLPNNIREQGPPRPPYAGPDQQFGPPPPPARPPHLSPYRPQMFGNPAFQQRGPSPNSSQPSGMRPPGPPPDYSTPGPYGGGYGYYPPPPLSVPHSAPPPPTASAVPSSVIVSAASLASASTSASSAPAPTVAPPPPPQTAAPSRPPVSSPSLIEKPCAPTVTTVAAPSVIEISRKKLTTLETFNTLKTATPPPPLIESSESRSPYSSNPTTVDVADETPDDGNSGSPPASSSQSTSEFSGLVSYFSSQHDDLNT